MMDSFQKNYKADDLNNADVLSNAWNYMFLSVSVFNYVMDNSPPPFFLALYIYLYTNKYLLFEQFWSLCLIFF